MGRTIYVNASDFLDFTETITVHPKGLVASDTLLFKETVKCSLKIGNITQHIVFDQSATHRNVINRSIHQYLSFEESAKRILPSNVYQNFSIWQRVNKNIATNTLKFTEQLDVTVSKNAKNRLLFTQLAIVKISRQKIINQSLVFQQSSLGYLLNRAAITPVSAGPGTGVVFTYFDKILELPSPEFDNTDSVELLRINRKTRGGDLIVYRDNMWPLTETLLMRWESLTEKQSKDLLDFLKLTLGQIIGLTDYNGNTYVGIITKPEGSVSQKSGSRFVASLEYQITYNWV